MSSITFPYAGHGHSASSSFISVQDSHHGALSSPAYEAPDDTSSFQMNPLSSHPPRTPRTSAASAGHTHTNMNGNGSHMGTHGPGADAYAYDAKADARVSAQTFEVADSEDSEAEAEAETEADAAGKARGGVRREAVWREMLKSANGRDKAFVRPVVPLHTPDMRTSCFGSRVRALTVRRCDYRNCCSTR